VRGSQEPSLKKRPSRWARRSAAPSAAGPWCCSPASWAGKTTIAKGIIQGLGAAAPDDVSSPTYTLIHEFGEDPKVYHIDLYRLEAAGEVLALGIDELLDGDAILLIEWGERFPALWPPNRIEIRLAALDETTREVSVIL